MNYIVFDLEWNQSPNGKEDSVEHLPFEIIEIGAVKLNGNFEETGTFHKLIRPKVYKKMHFKISEVTHMDMAELRQAGEPFDVVMNRFLAWCGGGGVPLLHLGFHGFDRASEEYGISQASQPVSQAPSLSGYPEALLPPVRGRKKQGFPRYGGTASGNGGGEALSQSAG